MGSIVALPDDILWILLKDHVVETCRKLTYFQLLSFDYDRPTSTSQVIMDLEAHRGSSGHHPKGEIAIFVLLPLAKVHPKIRRCLKRRCVWYQNGGWDFKANLFK